MKTFLVLLVLACGRLSAVADDVIDLIMDVHSPWDYLSVSIEHHCSCLGVVYEEGVVLKQERPNEITVKTWTRRDAYTGKTPMIHTTWRDLKDCTPTELRDHVVKLLKAAMSSDCLQSVYRKLPKEKRADFEAKLTLEERVMLHLAGDDTYLMIELSWKGETKKMYYEQLDDENESSAYGAWIKKVAPELSKASH
ncbi:MAG: hypothetical protein U1F81_15750 [Verrucomicrobiaceae bacterium]